MSPLKGLPSFSDLSGQKPLFSAGGSVHAGPVSSGLALRKLGDRVQLLNLLVTRLRQKVRRSSLWGLPPREPLLGGGLGHGSERLPGAIPGDLGHPLTSLCLFSSEEGAVGRSWEPVHLSCACGRLARRIWEARSRQWRQCWRPDHQALAVPTQRGPGQWGMCVGCLMPPAHSEESWSTGRVCSMSVTSCTSSETLEPWQTLFFSTSWALAFWGSGDIPAGASICIQQRAHPVSRGAGVTALV